MFLGKDLCRNDRWLQIAKDYTMATEREVHRVHTIGLDLETEPAEAKPAAAEDDVLF